MVGGYVDTKYEKFIPSVVFAFRMFPATPNDPEALLYKFIVTEPSAPSIITSLLFPLSTMLVCTVALGLSSPVLGAWQAKGTLKERVPLGEPLTELTLIIPDTVTQRPTFV